MNRNQLVFLISAPYDSGPEFRHRPESVNIETGWFFPVQVLRDHFGDDSLLDHRDFHSLASDYDLGRRRIYAAPYDGRKGGEQYAGDRNWETDRPDPKLFPPRHACFGENRGAKLCRSLGRSPAFQELVQIGLGQLLLLKRFHEHLQLFEIRPILFSTARSRDADGISRCPRRSQLLAQAHRALNPRTGTGPTLPVAGVVIRR